MHQARLQTKRPCCLHNTVLEDFGMLVPDPPAYLKTLPFKREKDLDHTPCEPEECVYLPPAPEV